MRSSALLLLALAACGGPDYRLPTGEGDPAYTPVIVHGVVFDSVTGVRLRGVGVWFGGKLVTTDTAGSFTVPARAGLNSAHLVAPGYEPYQRDFEVQPYTSFDLLVRRLAPFPMTCGLSSAGFRAVVVDLQGRKSLERWSESSLTLVSPSGTRTIGALNWDYVPLDTYHWEVSIPDADLATSRVDWVLFDSQGDVYRGSCLPEGEAGPDSPN